MDLKRIISAAGLRQVDLAQLSGVSQRQINALCTGASKLGNTTLTNAVSISAALGMTVEELMSDDTGEAFPVSLTAEAEGLPLDERILITKCEQAKRFSGWGCYPAIASKLVERIPEEWWGKYSAKHLGEIMRLLERAYSDGLDSHRLE